MENYQLAEHCKISWLRNLRVYGLKDFDNSLITTAKMNDVDPQAWLADILARIADHPANKLEELMPWNWAPQPKALAA